MSKPFLKLQLNQPVDIQIVGEQFVDGQYGRKKEYEVMSNGVAMVYSPTTDNIIKKIEEFRLKSGDEMTLVKESFIKDGQARTVINVVQKGDITTSPQNQAMIGKTRSEYKKEQSTQSSYQDWDKINADKEEQIKHSRCKSGAYELIAAEMKSMPFSSRAELLGAITELAVSLYENEGEINKRFDEIKRVQDFEKDISKEPAMKPEALPY